MTGGRGRPRPEPIRTCREDACGLPSDSLDESDPLLTGWIRVAVYGSTVPERSYCTSRCAAIGIARAQLRMSG